MNTKNVQPDEDPAKWSSKVYARYVDTGFGRGHTFSDAEYALQSRFYRRNYAEHLPSDKSLPILEVACGAGHFLSFLQELGYRDTLGVDLSPQCVALCKERGLRASAADAFEHLQRTSDRYGAVVCNDFLEHLTKDRGVCLVRAILQALRPGGVALVKVPNAACPVGASRTAHWDLTHETSFTDHSLQTMFEVCGYDRVKVLGTDIYVTRVPLANMAARLLFRASTLWYRGLELLYGIQTPHVMTKSILAVAYKPNV